jgi:hypothetical protein
MLVGQVVKVGFTLSLTITLNVQLAWLPLTSVAVQVTVVVPFGKLVPEAGEQTTLPTPQLSVAVALS